MGEFKSYLNSIKLKLRELEDYSKNEEILLVMYSLNQTREKIFLKDTISCQEKQKINRKLFRRMKGEPLNKIFKKQNFYGFDFKVNNSVLAPRVETEILVEKVINEIKGRKSKIDLLDLCTGSGCIGLSIKKVCNDKIDKLVLLDIDNKALRVAKENKKLLNISGNVKILKSNMFERLKSSQKFDIITCNPPYITEQEYKNLPVSVKNFDPKISLVGGKEGLDYYKILARESKKYLKSDGKIFVEIGFKQKDKVEKLFRENGFNVECFKDFSRKNRVIVGSFSERLSND